MLWFLKDKASRIERIVGEHQLFSQGLKELQDWLCEAQRVLNTCVSSTVDKSTLEDRMLQLEVRKEIIGPDPLKNKPQLCLKSILQCFGFLGRVNKHHAILDLKYFYICSLCAGLAGCTPGKGDSIKDASDTRRSSTEEHFSWRCPSDPQTDPGPQGLMGLAAFFLYPL